jgi:hypothetical protein
MGNRLESVEPLDGDKLTKRATFAVGMGDLESVAID